MMNGDCSLFYSKEIESIAIEMHLSPHAIKSASPESIFLTSVLNAIILACHVTGGAAFHALVRDTTHAVRETLGVRGIGPGPQRVGVHRIGQGQEAGKVDERKGDELHCW
jgi:hypothetical protein